MATDSLPAMKNSRRSVLPGAPGAFTLVEMLVVITIMAALMALSAPYIVGTMQANRLTAAGEGLMFRLSRLQQVVASTNQPGEIRFYRFEMEGVTGYHAYQLFSHDEATGGMSPLEDPVYFKTDNLRVMEGTLSPLLTPSVHSNVEGMWPRAADTEPFLSRNAQYFRISFLPSGKTSLHAPLRQCYLTLSTDDPTTSVTSSRAPKNYYTIQIDPVSGRAKSYRP